MDCRDKSDVFFLIDEKFDFDVSLSPASSNGDEDEVFVGPVGHAERCVSANVASLASGGGVRTSWSPLNGEQLDAMCQEAQRVAGQLQCASLLVPPSVPDEATGAFSQDAEAQLAAVDRRASALSPVKRQTFCVQDSPMKQLPPAIRHRLLTERGATTATPTRPGTTATPARPATTATSVPTLGVAVVLPSKPAAATIPCAAGKRKAERLQPPSKVGEKRSPSSRPPSRGGSCEDLLSDSASVASDISDSSLNSSILGKRTMAPPTKRALGNQSGVKAPPLQRMRGTERKNTSSSSSSVSSFNSSLSLSPATGTQTGTRAYAILMSSIPPAPLVCSRLPQKPISSVPLTPSVKARRPSALPTPVRRRMSGIPVATPTRPPPTFDFDPASVQREMKSRKFTAVLFLCSPAPADAQEAEPVNAPDVQPFCLEEEEEPPAAPPTSPDQSENSDPRKPTFSPFPPQVLLLDLPAPTPQPHEKLLIDLTNTPDLIRTSGTASTQLIDLSSPLIKWSPEEKRENNAPLINLSF
uniref:G2 and S phase-expressed protein 1 N-terminal domain-containing protein n=1 Tax=Gasterosteus aculeatus aculeatus TaxID=481459 RepID=A0AAQ4Q8W3_GASAC